MILPNNGKIIIIDDKESDVKPLILALKKEKMPFLFFTDQGGDDLPDNGPVSNVRLVFLDLDLGIGDSSDRKQKVRIVQERLVHLIEPNTPYVLVIWSTHEDTLLDLLLEDFRGKLKDYAPMVHCSFDKQDTLHNGHTYPFQIIRDKLKIELGKFEAFNIFLFWESSVGNSVGRIVNDFTNFIPNGEDWNDQVRYILYRLAKAYSGKQIDEEDFADHEKLKSAFATLNQNLVDTIEFDTVERLEKFEISTGFFEKPVGFNEFICVVNTKLLLGNAGHSGLVPGNIFFPILEFENSCNDLDQKLEKLKNNSRIPADKKDGVIRKGEEQNKTGKKQLEIEKNQFSQNYKRILSDGLSEEGRDLKEEILGHSKFIELNISPLCDYAQNKLPCCRLVPGLLVKDVYYEYLNKGAAYSYISDVPIKYESNQYFLMFDFRYLYSKNSNLVKRRKAIIKLKHLILADIQLKLGNHVNRAGVIYA